MPSHLRHSPWRFKGIRTHPALQLSVIKSEGVLARVLSFAFSYSVKASLLSGSLVASNSILLEQSVCAQNNLIPLLNTTEEEKGDMPPCALIPPIGANKLPNSEIIVRKDVVKYNAVLYLFTLNFLIELAQIQALKDEFSFTCHF